MSSHKLLRSGRTAIASVVATALLSAGVIAPVPASAQSSLAQMTSSNYNGEWLGDTPFITGKTQVDGNFWVVDVWSPANATIVSNNVLLPSTNTPRSTVYLLPGIAGGTSGMNWVTNSDIKSWAQDKNANFVMPLGGKFSLYTDWEESDFILGVNKWETYMIHELPPLIDAEFNGTGWDAIAGLSSTGGAALDIAGHAPHRFRAAASYSGFPVRSGLTGGALSHLLISSGGGSSMNAFGVPGSSDWAEHDPAAHPERLINVAVFVGSAPGFPSGTNLTTFGPSVIERLANDSSNEFTTRARAAGVTVNRYVAQSGSHDFGLFFNQLAVSWDQTIRPAIGE